MAVSHGSGTASGNSTRPDPREPNPMGDDEAQGAGHPNEWFRPGVSPCLAAGPVVATAPSGNGVSKAEVGSAVPYLVPEMGRRGRRARPSPDAGAQVPRLAPGVEQLGEYDGSGLTAATYLVRKPNGQVVHLSRLLHLVLTGIDGSRTINEIAARATAEFGRTVSAGNVEYLLKNRFAPLGLLAADESAGPSAGAAGEAPSILALKVRHTLIPAPVVQPIARLFQPLFNPVVVVCQLIGLVASDVWLFRGGRLVSALRYMLLHPLVLLIVLGLTLLSTLFHECGHASACRYGGARPGVIGVGFYVVWPAFFTNVTDAYRLGRVGRIRTDLGGVYFNAIFVLLLAVTYEATGYVPLLAAILMVHLEIIQQLMPSLRFDGYFILADLIGVPDLFRRVGPTLRSLIPGQPADPRVGGLKRAARVILTVWVLLIVPMLGIELTLVILNLPGLTRTFASSVNNQLGALTAEFGRADVAAVLASAISMVLLALPMAGLGYILLTTGRRVLRALIAVNRRRPVLRLPSVAVVLLIAAGLAFHWGLLPISRGSAALPRPAAVTVLTPAGELKTGSGLILDMGRQVRLSSVSVTFGPPPGADASIEVGNGNTLTASTLPTFTTVAGARDVGGRYTFKCTGSVQGRYVLIRFTKLPSAGSGKFRAEISNIVVRGSG